MLSGQTPHGRYPNDSGLLKKILITILVVAVVGAAILVVTVALSHDKRRQDLLDEAPVDIRLHSRMEWRQVPAYNVYGWIPGSDEFLPDQSSRRLRDDVVALAQ